MPSPPSLAAPQLKQHFPLLLRIQDPVKGTGEAVMALSCVPPLCKQLLPLVSLGVGVWTGQMRLFGWICCWSKVWRKKCATRDARNVLL